MRIALAALVTLSFVLAGCLSSADGGDGDDDPSSSGSKSATATGTGTKSGSASKTGTGTTVSPALPKSATLVASATNGTAPLLVNFTANATAGFASWRLSFGDGSSTNGTSLPATVNHTYAVGGNFSANLTVTYSGGAKANATQAITVATPSSTPGTLPDVTHFEFGPSLGCAGDAYSASGGDVPLNCASFQGGPDASGIDGHWLAVDERYWGLQLTTTMTEPTGQNHDSDCFFFAADETTQTGDGTNGGEACLGIIPVDTAWVFLYPWGLPATAMTADFALPTA